MKQYRVMFTENDYDGEGNSHDWIQASNLDESEVQHELDDFNEWRKKYPDYECSEPWVECREVTEWTKLTD